MKIILTGCLILLLACVVPVSAYESRPVDGAAQRVGLCRGEQHEDPGGFEPAWRCARECWESAVAVKESQAAEWKKTCAQNGALGMRCAERAMAIEPERPEGYYYYALNAGTYADGVSTMAVLLAGLKGKVQRCLEKVYELDRMYDNAEAILGLGRFWAVVPWPFKDRRKALAYYREYQSTRFFSQKDEARLYLAELLLELGGSENAAEARSLLEAASASDTKAVEQQAKKLMAETGP